MEPEFRDQPSKPLSTNPEEEHEGLRILSRLIAKAIINDARLKQTGSLDKPSI